MLPPRLSGRLEGQAELDTKWLSALGPLRGPTRLTGSSLDWTSIGGGRSGSIYADRPLSRQEHLARPFTTSESVTVSACVAGRRVIKGTTTVSITSWGRPEALCHGRPLVSGHRDDTPPDLHRAAFLGRLQGRKGPNSPLIGGQGQLSVPGDSLMVRS